MEWINVKERLPDKNDRWKVGSKIHFIINPRTPNRFQFAPVLEVKSIQEIIITRNKYLEYMYQSKVPLIYINNELITDFEVVKTLAQNDGFNNVEDFFKWFDKDFSGKIIHWTDLKY